MKILQINNYHFLKGGSDAVYINTGQLLEKYGHSVVYFSTNNEKNISHGVNKYFVAPVSFEKGNVLSKIRKVSRFIYSKEAYRSLKELIKNEQPQIAHLHIFYGNLTSSILKALKEAGIPIVMSVHEYRMLCPVYLFLNNKNEVCEKCATGNYFNAIINKCNKGSYMYSTVSALETFYRDKFYDYKAYVDYFIMVSNFIKEKHLEYFPEIKNKVSVLYNFKDFNNNSDISNSLKEADLVYFGRLSKEKGILTLLNVLKKKKQVTLKIIGTGPELENIKNFIQLNLMENVSMLGYCTGDDLWNHVKSAKYSVVPSECYENNPMSAIESLFLGVPLIGAEIGGIPEIIKKEHGFTFVSGSEQDLEIKIDEALNLDNETYQLLQLNAIVCANKMFASTSHYQSLIEIYQKTINKVKSEYK